MVTMGGGPEVPSKTGSKGKELVLAVLPWPKEKCQQGISALEKEFEHLEVQHYYSHIDNGKVTVDDIPDGLPAKASYIATLFWLPETADKIPKTKLIQFFSAGTNHVAKHPIYTDSKIPLCSANGVHGPQIAEWVVMMDLVHSHHYTKLYDLQKKQEWNQRAAMNVDDRVGKRVAILGYGSIGRQGMLGTHTLHNTRLPCVWFTDSRQWLVLPKLWAWTSSHTRPRLARRQSPRETTGTSFRAQATQMAACPVHGTAGRAKRICTTS